MPLLWVSTAFLIGLLAGDALNLPWPVWVLLGCLFLALTLFDPLLCKKSPFWQKIRSRLPVSVGLLLLLLALGGFRFWMTTTPVWQEDDLAFYNDRGHYLITGWVSAAPDQRDDRLVYEISVIEIEDPTDPDWVHAARKVHGRAQVRTYADAPWEYGDLLQFTANPLTPSENRDFSYREYLAAFDIHTAIYHPQNILQVGSGYGSSFRKGLIRLREKAWQTIFAIYPQPESGLLAGILLGMDQDLPESLAQSYRDTGVSHIIAISGFNMVVLAGMFLLIFSRLFGPYWAALISGIVLSIYTLFVDGSPSVVRALVMVLMGAGGHLIGRRQMGLNALGFTAAVMCLVNPLLVRNISFQLSFAATFGLVVFAQPLQEWLKSSLETRFSEKLAGKLTGPLSEYFLFTLAAQFATLPVIAWHFGRVSISSLLANPLILPVQPALLVLGGLTTAAGLIHPLAGKAFMLFSWPLLRYTNFMVALLAKIKGGALSLHPSFAIWILILVVLFLLTFTLRNYFKKLFHSGRFIWIILGLGCAAFSVWSIYLHRPDGLLHLRLLRCEDEVTLTLQTPGGETVLINPRGDVNELTSSLERSLSLWAFHVDAVLLTNRKSAAEMEALVERITVRRVFLAPSVYRLDSGEQPITLPDGMEITKLLPGQALEIEPGLSLTLLSENLEETAILLEYGSLRSLIPNGVDYADLKLESPSTLQGITALVLGLGDVSYIPLRVWTQLEPAAILWNSATLSPFTESFGIDTRVEVNLISDGTKSWIEP